MKRCMSRQVVIDVGNTSTSIGCYRNGVISHAVAIRGGIGRPDDVAAALRRAGGNGRADGAVLASVTPQINAQWRRLVEGTLGVPLLIVDCGLKLPVRIRYPHPRSIGADRLANASGGLIRYGAPLLIADFGTALTFDVLSADGAYIGGVIAPGLPLMTDYLHEKTALLPRIGLGGRCPPVGRSTQGAMRIGARVGYRGMVREIVHHLRATLGADARLCATGGYARWALDGLEMPCTFDPDLTLFGLGCIFDLNLT